MAKMVSTELQCKVVDECLQFFGGYGYMLEYPIARAYIDSRVRRIAGGSSEVMREIISRSERLALQNVKGHGPASMKLTA